jgi:alkylation response protein AidB-like acyl-CoA dehydrogenase
MDVRFTAEQRALRDSVAQVVDRLGPKAVGQLDDASRVAKLDSAVTASGWRELRVAGDARAPLASAVEVAIVAEELARGLADTAFVGPTLATELRRLATADADIRETIALRPKLAELTVPGGFAVAIDTAGADAAVVLAVGGALSSVPIGGARSTIDLTRPTRAIDVSSGHMIGRVSADDIARCEALALAVTTADLVGTMQGAIDLTLDYAKEREQYGTPIGSFQAVAHLLADARVHLEGSRTALLHAAWAVDALEAPDALVAASSAKAYAARAGREVCEIAIQVHGGIGNTWECLAHVYLRRALLATDILGGVGPNLTRVLAGAGIGG